MGTGSQPDGIGDACQCGDVDNDGFVTSIDKTILGRALLNLSPYTAGVTALPGYEKCDVNGDGLCNNNDATIIGRAAIGIGPGIVQTCTAAVCHSPEMINGVTCPVLP